MVVAGYKYVLKKKHLEGWFWIIAIGALALTNPLTEGHGTLCVVRNLNFGFCPGCGLGHSIGWFFRGNVAESFSAHPLGIPAIVILMARSYQLLKDGFTRKEKLSDIQ